MTTQPAVLAVDGGNSKADVVLVASDGALLGRVVGPSVSHQAVGLAAGLATLMDLARRAAAAGGFDPESRPVATIGSLCLAGADSPADIRRLQVAIGDLGLVERLNVRNDTDAPLRAGTDEGWGVAVVCGSGMNALGRAPGGRVARFAGLGDISGDRGGGGGAGMLALGAAAAAQERRGPRTSLERHVPMYFGLRRPLDVSFAIEGGRLSQKRLRELAPVVFAAAHEGDAVAIGIVDRVADEAVAFATGAIARLGMSRRPVPVVLAGGLFRANDERFLARIRAGITRLAPAARITVLDSPPVLGAALLGLDALGASAGAKIRLRAELSAR